jgi:hypothetical protein
MASVQLNSEIYILKGQNDVDTFRLKYPDGFTILDGDRGIGCIGSMAEKAKNIGGDPNDWIAFANQVGPSIHQSYKE